MADHIDALFLRTLRAYWSAKQNIPEDIDSTSALDAVAVAEVLMRARRHRLTSLVLRGLESIDAGASLRDENGAPYQWSERLRTADNEALFLSMILHDGVRALSSCFTDLGLGHLFLKGVVSDHYFFGGRGHRGTTDIDVLVEDRVAAEQALETLGATPLVLAQFQETSKHAHGQPWVWTRSGKEIVIDLHTRLLEDPPLCDFSSEAFTAQRTYDGVPGLDPSQWLAYAAGNLTIDGISGRYKQMTDVHAIIQRYPDATGGAVIVAERVGVTDGLWALFSLVHKRFGTDIPAAALRTLRPRYRAKRALLRRIFGVDTAPLALGGMPTRLVVPDRRLRRAHATFRWVRNRALDRLRYARSESPRNEG